jgi:predicted lipoprotein with Yx(FWY)xxD motif
MKRFTSVALGTLAAAAIVTVPIVASATAASRVAQHSRSYTVEIAKTNLGKILILGTGENSESVLYLFTHDSRNKDTCAKIGGCTSIWPIATVSGKPTAGPGVKSSLLKTITVKGKHQLTYDGHPLYLYAEDEGVTDTGYVGTPQFGGTWDAVRASGSKVS